MKCLLSKSPLQSSMQTQDIQTQNELNHTLGHQSDLQQNTQVTVNHSKQEVTKYPAQSPINLCTQESSESDNESNDTTRRPRVLNFNDKETPSDTQPSQVKNPNIKENSIDSEKTSTEQTEQPALTSNKSYGKCLKYAGVPVTELMSDSSSDFESPIRQVTRTTIPARQVTMTMIPEKPKQVSKKPFPPKNPKVTSRFNKTITAETPLRRSPRHSVIRKRANQQSLSRMQQKRLKLKSIKENEQIEE